MFRCGLAVDDLFRDAIATSHYSSLRIVALLEVQGMERFISFSVLVAMVVAAHGAAACNSPLVLDLNGDGVQTTSVLWYPVRFDINGDGRQDVTGWLSPYSFEGFLWVDLNDNGVANSGRERF